MQEDVYECARTVIPWDGWIPSDSGDRGSPNKTVDNRITHFYHQSVTRMDVDKIKVIFLLINSVC